LCDVEENVRELFRELHARQRHIVDRMWSSLRIFTTLVAGLITATVTLYTHFSQVTQTVQLFYFSVPIKKLQLILPILNIILLCIGWRDIKREREACLEHIATLRKIEKYLGLHMEIDKSNRYFSMDEYLLPTNWVRTACAESTEDFVRKEMRECKQLHNIKLLYTLLGLASLALMFLILIS